MTGERPEALQAWTALCEVVDQVRVALNRDLQRGAGLTLAENLVLCQVAMAPGKRLRMVDIAGLLTIGKSAVTRTVDRLEERGLLRRDRDPADRRIVYPATPAEGADAFAAARPEYVNAVHRHFAGKLSEAEVRQLDELSRRALQRGAETGREHSAGRGRHPHSR